MATSHAGARLTAIADAYLAALTKAFPEFATSEDLPGADHGSLTDNTESGLARWQAYEEAALADLRAIPPQSLRDESDRVLHAVLLDEIERNVGVRVCRLELWGVASYVNGWQAVQWVGWGRRQSNSRRSSSTRKQAEHRAPTAAAEADHSLGGMAPIPASSICSRSSETPHCGARDRRDRPLAELRMNLPVVCDY